MSKRSTKKKCSRLIRRLTGRSLRNLVITAGFPCHKSPHLYQWLRVFILLPFPEEDTLNDLAEKYGKELRKLYKILTQHPKAFGKLFRMLAMPLFYDLFDELDGAGATTMSRRRIRIIIDDTNAEKYGKHTEFMKKLSDHCKDRYIMGYNYVLMLAVSGDTVFPLSFVLRLPKEHSDYRSKNDIARDEILRLKKECGKKGYDLGNVEILSDSAFCRRKVVKAAQESGFCVITKPGNTHKFEFEGELLKPGEIIGRVADRDWKYLEANHCYQRISAHHHMYGKVVLIVRRRRLKNRKIVYDVVMCSKVHYTAPRIHKAYKKRWETEMHFKYYKQYLSLGKAQFQKLGSIRSHLACVAIAGLTVAVFRGRFHRKISFRRAVKLITRELWDG